MDSQLFDKCYKAELITTFKFVIDFLNENKINWFAAGGTAIGAVRHHGIIPWDDDIDIHIPRRDFEKLQQIANKLDGTPYKFISLENNDEYYLPIAKIYNTNTTLVESRITPMPIGIYIDIFPMDQCPFDSLNFSTKLKKYNHARQNFVSAYSRYSFLEFVDNIKGNNKGCIIYGLRSLFFPYKKRKEYRNSFMAIEKMFDCDEGDYLVTPSGAYGAKEHYKLEWYNDYILCPFEDFQVRLPQGYNDYLTMMYGDYLTPPPIEKQISHHAPLYINLREGLSLTEVRKRIKKGERRVV